jgi:hypothetical protein
MSINIHLYRCSYVVTGVFISHREIQKFIKNKNIAENKKLKEKTVVGHLKLNIAENEK